MTAQPADCAVTAGRMGVFETGWPGQVQDLSATNKLGFIRIIAGEIAFDEVKARAMGQPLAVD